MAVYVLKFARPIGNPDKPFASARYYVGYSADENLPDLIRAHWEGTSGVNIVSHFRAQGIPFTVVNVLWGLDRTDERRIKRSGNYKRLDPANRSTPYRPKKST